MYDEELLRLEEDVNALLRDIPLEEGLADFFQRVKSAGSSLLSSVMGRLADYVARVKLFVSGVVEALAIAKESVSVAYALVETSRIVELELNSLEGKGIFSTSEAMERAMSATRVFYEQAGRYQARMKPYTDILLKGIDKSEEVFAEYTAVTGYEIYIEMVMAGISPKRAASAAVSLEEFSIRDTWKSFTSKVSTSAVGFLSKVKAVLAYFKSWASIKSLGVTAFSSAIEYQGRAVKALRAAVDWLKLYASKSPALTRFFDAVHRFNLGLQNSVALLRNKLTNQHETSTPSINDIL